MQLQSLEYFHRKKNFKGQERGLASEEWKNHLPIVVITVPAKKKDELMSQRLVWLNEFSDGFTPARTAETTCWSRKWKYKTKRGQKNISA